MNLFRLLVLGILGWLGWRTYRNVRHGANERERQLSIRALIALWILGALFLMGLLALPPRGKVLLLIPLALVLGSGAKAYFKSRREIRAAADMDAKLNNMKRVN